MSFGYLALFVTIEPHAYAHFREILCLPPLPRTNRLESKDTFSQASGSKKLSGDAHSSASAGEAQSSATIESNPNTGDTLSTNAYVARESSLYNIQMQPHQNQPSYGWMTASLFKRDVEEEDDRDEESLLQSINSESQLAPFRLSTLREDFGVNGRSSRASLSSNIRSAVCQLMNSGGGADAPDQQDDPGASGGSGSSSRSATLNMSISLQSSTSSPMTATMTGMRDSEL